MLRTLHVTPEWVARQQPSVDAFWNPRIARAKQLFDSINVAAESNRWLEGQAWKRVVTDWVYRPLLENPDWPVLDVGGGLGAPVVELARNPLYELVERATHEGREAYQRLEASIGRGFVRTEDWAETDAWDGTIVANDVFPNVDQRLQRFLDRCASKATRVRASLTYYPDLYFDVVRKPSGEHLVMKAANAELVQLAVSRFAETVGEEWDEEVPWEDMRNVLFTNQRNIFLLEWERNES